MSNNKNKDKTIVSQNPSKLQRLEELYDVQQALLEGKSTRTIVQELAEKYNMPMHTAYSTYFGKLKELMPSEDQLDAYKRTLIQTNLDRIENIIQNNLNANSVNEKKLALEAIKELNKMLGLYEKNTVTINRDNQGEETIQISFDN